MALSMMLGGLGMFWWTRSIAGADEGSSREVAARAGLLAGVIYMLWPPLLVNNYVVGAFGTALFLGLLPWAFAGITSTRLALDSTAHHDEGKGEFAPLPRILFLVMMATLLVFADPTLGLVSLPFLIIWTLWPPRTWAARLTAMIAVLVGGIWAVDLIWLFGAGTGIKQFFSTLDIESFLAHSIHPYQLLSPAWGFGVSTPDWKDDVSFQLGLVALGLAVLTVAFCVQCTTTGDAIQRGSGRAAGPVRVVVCDSVRHDLRAVAGLHDHDIGAAAVARCPAACRPAALSVRPAGTGGTAAGLAGRSGGACRAPAFCAAGLGSHRRAGSCWAVTAISRRARRRSCQTWRSRRILAAARCHCCAPTSHPSPPTPLP